MQIGDVAEHTGLSLRTIRYYEEASLVTPSTRTTGGFRLYTTADCDRLDLIKRMKPLGFSLDEMRDMLHVLDELADGADATTLDVLRERLERFAESVDERRERLKEQVLAAGELAELLRAHAPTLSGQGGSR
ncbi:MAG: MerR family transcriptional regulator [Actinobacteria bacterium HGW-Actinobacteria-7]|jgi:DNA-binding transcriptional MerR regulator|nr:MAG: MerR family transcriptional regulator [Actinobacteria bacterium HGW-Actinobacteria-7]